MTAPKRKPAAQVAAARKAKKLKDESESKAKFGRPPSDAPRRRVSRAVRLPESFTSTSASIRSSTRRAGTTTC